MASQPIAKGSLIGRGGEGDVFEVPDQRNLAVKIYHKPPTPERIAKLEAMVAMKDVGLADFAAWPMKLIRSRSDGLVSGFMMPRVQNHYTIHHLYSPKSRMGSFPEADFRFLVHVGMNIARAIARFHAAGCVLGDINYGNLLVSPSGLVRFIDCDSYQIRDSTGRLFRCEVGEPTFTPPELQGIELRTVDRTTNHDAFGLAILLFHLLFQGRHPFSGRFHGSGDMSIERAIREFRFAYGRANRAKEMEPPPHSLHLTEVSRDVAALFEQAFAPENAGLGRRPLPTDWSTALEGMGRGLVKCPVNSAHYHLGSGCPWCRLEAGSGIILFLTRVAQVHSVNGGDLAAHWAAIEAVLPPPQTSSPTLSSPRQIRPSSAAVALRRKVRLGRMAGWTLCLFGLLIAIMADGLGTGVRWLIALGASFAGFHIASKSVSADQLAEYKQKEDSAASEFDRLERQWKERADPALFHKKLDDLKAARKELIELPRYRENELKKLQAKQHEIQLKTFLESYEITDATIEGIGASRKATLLSYGIETAYDVESSALQGVPGVGPVLINRLLQWRSSVQLLFHFDPRKPLDAKAVDAVNRDISSRQTRLEGQLRAGANELSTLAARIRQYQNSLAPLLERAAEETLRARADLAAIS